MPAEIATIKPEYLAEMCQVLTDHQLQHLAFYNERVARTGGPLPRHERLPLTDHDGYEFGRVVAQVPKTEFFTLLKQHNFGMEGFTSEEGLRDLLRDRPHCRVKTVSGKIMAGYGGKWDGRRRDALAAPKVRPGKGRWG